MKKTFKYRIKIPIYNTFIDVIITDKFEKYAKKYEFEGDPNNFSAFVQTREITNGKNKGALIYLFLSRHNIKDKVIVHEAKHLVNRIFKYRNIGIDYDNDEPECYLLGFIYYALKKCFKKI